MNSRNSVNETNLVNFSADLTTLNQLDTKEGLLTFPFDHIYACHSGSAVRRQTLQLDKEVEITTHCVVAEDKDLLGSSRSEINRLTDKLSVTENQNKKLKDLLIYHLDLIQQQNESMTKTEKLYQALREENDCLKNKLNRMEGKLTLKVTPHRQSVNPPPLVHVPSPPVTSTVVKSEPGTSSQILYNSFTEFVLPEIKTNPYLFNNDIEKPKPFDQVSNELSRSSDSDLANYMASDLGVPSSILDSNLSCENFTMIENKRSYLKKDTKTEKRSEPLYTITSNSGNPAIQKIQRNRRRTSTGIGALSRMSKSTASRVDVPETSKMFEEDKVRDRAFNINKKSKINTYGKSRTSTLKRTSQFTGSLSDRLQLIDTTPTGEDPYQLGEADMREQSPIPKLMLQKTHGRLKICTDTLSESTTPSKRIYEPAVTETIDKVDSVKLESYKLAAKYLENCDIDKNQPKTLMVQEPDLDLVKTETEIDWRIYSPTAGSRSGIETSLCDFSYGENSNLASQLLPGLEDVGFPDFFSSESPLNLDSLNALEYNPPIEKSPINKTKKRGNRTSSLLGPNAIVDESKHTAPSKRGRKRALSTTGVAKGGKNSQKGTGPKTKTSKRKATCRGKKSPVPGLMTLKTYHTLVGDPDLSWYLGLDPEVKLDDIDPPADSKTSTVEVPRWREKPYTSYYTLEGTENLDDKIFAKRHQKLEAEERRQLRWHMRRIREQRHVERLKQRQRDSWCSGNASPATQQPSVYTIWPHPQRDAMVIEITDILPVTAFGVIMANLPEVDFVLPWVRSSKALKRSKRSKTLH